MKYWFDTEFIERGHEFPIDLLSIGVVAEDGREFYAQLTEGLWYNGGEWIEQNVFPQMLPCPRTPDRAFDSLILQKANHEITGRCQNDCPWMRRYEVRASLLDFCDPKTYGKPQFWGWFADYDWVLFAQLFGRMIDLPKGFPMYCMDVKQLCVTLGDPKVPKQQGNDHNALADARWTKATYEWLVQRQPVH